MGISATGDAPPLRLWPGVALVTLQWLIRFGVPAVIPEAVAFALIGGLVAGVAVLLWWLFFSRAPWLDRLGAVALIVASMFAARRFVDPSIATGAQNMLFPILAIPVVSLAFVVWAVACRHLSPGLRRATMAATILLACSSFALVRTGGFNGSFRNDLHWRWTTTPEQRLLASREEALIVQPAPVVSPAPVRAPALAVTPAPARLEPKPIPPPPPAKSPETGAGWPGFRGPDRAGAVPGVRIETDWSASPPAEMWRRPVGPGWSSFAVQGDLFYTQEQRGDDEVVACYRVSNGAPVWRHRDSARYWEANAGAGPRATPTLSGGRVYTLGATGIVNALDANTGAAVWTRNASADTGAKLPGWGFAGSPLVTGGVVVVAASGTLIAYAAAAGEPRWTGPAGRESHSSPHLATISGVPQILMLSGSGVASFDPERGTLLWEHQWRGYPIVQPALTSDGDVLLSVSDSSGTRRLSPRLGPSGWSVSEHWTSLGLKPYFNDFVVHKGHAYGFDGSILACIGLEDGARKWKGGRYGAGQLVLLPAQDLLLVLSEEGELALVRAVPGEYAEVARFPAIQGKTWNHPVLAGSVLLVRNSEQMAAFRLSLPH